MSSPFDAAQAMASIWMDFAGKMGTAGMAFAPDSSPPDLARQMRSATFDAMTQNADQYLRSPQFLDIMKKSMDASIAFRKQLNDLLTGIHHSTQGVAQQDVDSLLLSVRHLERRTLDRLETITERLDQIAQRLEAMETANDNHRAEVSHV